MKSHTTRLLLIRHGQSIANIERRVQGWSDDPLTSVGAAQAHLLANWFRTNSPRADLLFSSPLQRAYQTATPISSALGLDIQLHPELKEINLGLLEDVPESAFALALNSDNYAEYGVETDQVFSERVVGALDEMRAAYAGSTLIVVTHLGVISTALACWLDGNITIAWEKYGHIRNTSINEVIFQHDRITLLRHNATPHLDE